jgi:hypothetical protein
MPSTLTDTEIANLALSKLGPGGGYVVDLSTDDTVAGEALRRVYAAIRDEVLEAHGWGFATKRAALAADPTAPAWGYDLRYPAPSDSLKVLAVRNPLVDETQAYSEEDGYILTDITAPLYVRYLTRVTNPGKFSATFIAALAARLADEICETITKSAARRDKLQKEYGGKLIMARKFDNLGRASQPPPDGRWNDSRWTG